MQSTLPAGKSHQLECPNVNMLLHDPTIIIWNGWNGTYYIGQVELNKSPFSMDQP